MNNTISPSKEFYRDHIVNTLLPFWERALDHTHGGLYTCFDNPGTTLISRDKYVWSQGRFLWMWSRFAESVRKGNFQGTAVQDPSVYEAHARKTAEFLRDHAFMENGNTIFLLSEDGKPKHAYEGIGLDASIYADCFACLGFSEYGRVFGKEEYVRRALDIYRNILSRLESGRYETMPYPIPAECGMFGIPMFSMYTGGELARALKELAFEEAGEITETALSFARTLERDFFILPHNLEIRGPADMEDTLLSRHITPGHTLECLWFYIHFMEFAGKTGIYTAADTLGRYALDHGWDDEYGGLFRFIDREGGKPRGRIINNTYEKLILDTWDTKLWWIHSESLYLSALMAKRLDSDYWEKAHRKIFDYTFSTFPNPDKSVGEWIQIHRRDGSPLNEVVALPVKDPYHIFRNLLLLLEL